MKKIDIAERVKKLSIRPDCPTGLQFIRAATFNTVVELQDLLEDLRIPVERFVEYFNRQLHPLGWNDVLGVERGRLRYINEYPCSSETSITALQKYLEELAQQAEELQTK